ncbi:hypothetical protein GA0070616_4528 [Micromonospora nigra]|uniref:Uncharacterized protein n=1 Tax=Micromonospora nigra TaxID=145857 RepID=A0A1C6STV8_9ACTN|nr:hypothetical protein [Micromonospora nigra]SCL32693.1 hypothetical protein GA0070616_4528 [Micromonospora nigra]
MRERPHDGPLPQAHPSPGAGPRHPDGDRVPCPPRPGRAGPTRRQYAYGIVVAVVVLLLFVAGVFR